MQNDPLKFKCDFAYHYMEDENGFIPKPSEGLVSYIPLEVIVEDNLIKFFGKPSIYKISCYDIKLNHHNYGMFFSIICRNVNETFKGKIPWRRAITKHFLHKFFSETDKGEMTLEGDCPDVPNSLVSIAKLKLRKEKHDYKVESVSFEMTLEAYDQFIKQYTD